MKFRILFISILVIFTFHNCKDNPAQSRSKIINGIFVDFDDIEKVRKQIRQKNEYFLAAYNALVDKAEIALNENPYSVIDKKKVPPSGDKHDYLSMGPYWWPDPSKPNGLPYIRRDGEVNPETRGENVDTDKKSKMLNNVETLTWAFYFSGNNKYAQKAVELIETWFVNRETKMNPNLNYAQGIPGRQEGRGIGIIDFSGINKLISPAQILESHGKFTVEIREKLYDWFDQYLNWLITSDYGKDEDDERNNHGTWFDVQSAGIALFLGKTEMAKARLENVKAKRIATQIEPDGSQPLEIARTRSLSYSSMNLRGFIHLANMARTVGVDLWNFETADGRGIRKALDFLLPYVKNKKKWESQQITDLEEALEGLKINYIIGAVKTGNDEYLEVMQSLSKPATELEILLYPVFDEQ